MIKKIGCVWTLSLGLLMNLEAFGAIDRTLCTPAEMTAATEELVTIIESDVFPGVIVRVYALENDGGELRGMMTHRSDTRQVARFSLCDLQSGEAGFTHDGHRAIVLRASDIRPASGGNLRLSYLYNGIWGTMAHMDIMLTRSRTGWSLERREVQIEAADEDEACTADVNWVVFNRLFMHKRTLFRRRGRTIGIRAVTPYQIDLQRYELSAL